MNSLLVRVRENERRHEFIRGAAFILRAHGRGWRGFTSLSPAKHHGVPGFFRSVPTPVAIHREISADHGSDSRAAFRQLSLASFEEARTPGGRGIPPVGKRVNEDV